MQKDLSKLSLVALRKLFFEETRAFLAAIDTENADELRIRRERIRSIDKTIETKKPSSKQPTLF